MSTNKFINAYKNANREAVAESEDPQALIMVLLDELLRAMRAYVTIVEKQDDAKARKNDNLTRHLRDIEVVLIEAALEKCDGMVSQAAEALKLRRTTLIEKMKKLMIERPSAGESSSGTD